MMIITKIIFLLCLCKLTWNAIFLSFAGWNYCRNKVVNPDYESKSIELLIEIDFLLLFFLSILFGIEQKINYFCFFNFSLWIDR